MEVLSSGDLFNPPSSPAGIARCISEGIRKEQVGARHAIPTGGARDALLEGGERQGRELALERGPRGVVRHELAHRFVTEPARPGRQNPVYRERAQMREEGRWHSRCFAGTRRHAGIDERSAGKPPGSLRP